MGGDQEHLDGGFEIEWDYLNAEHGRTKNPSILSQIQPGVFCESAFIRMLSNTETLVAHRSLFLGITQIDTDPFKTIFRG